MATAANKVQSFYDANVDLEDQRLDDGRLEHAVTLHTILQLIKSLHSDVSSNVPLKIADVGCATGRYATELAHQGHSVTISDISDGLLRRAVDNASKRGVKFEGSYRCDASRLRSIEGLYRSDHYDIALLLGPLYHLLESADRNQALTDLISMVRPGGFALAAFVMRNAHLRDLSTKDPDRLEREQDFYQRYLQDGRYDRGSGAPMHHFTLKEVRSMVEDERDSSASFKVVKTIACEGFLGFHNAKGLAQLGEAAFQKWLDVIIESAEDEANLGAADHILVILQRLH